MDEKVISKLREYKHKNSNSRIRSRADSVLVKLKEKKGDYYLFSYQGSERKSYSVKLSLENGITTNCNCPYDYGGICKHQVSALNYIIEEKTLAMSQKDLFGKNVPRKLSPSEIYLENHYITDDLLLNLSERISTYAESYNVVIEEISQKKIVTCYEGWPREKQEIEYNSEKQLLKVKCSCKQSKKAYCKHTISVLEKIEEEFGGDFFHPNYLDKNKTSFLKEYGLTLKDDYQKYFDFTITKNGLSVTEKVKNIFPSTNSFSERILVDLTDESKDSLSILEKQKSENKIPTHGIGFCFTVYKHRKFNFFEFSAFRGKYKKHTTELATSFKEIGDYDLLSEIEMCDEKDKMVVIKALEAESENKRFRRDSSLDKLRETFIKLKEFIFENAETYQFFLKKKLNTSFIRRNLIEISFLEEEATLYFTLTQNDDFYTLRPKIRIEGKGYLATSKQITVYPFFCIKGEKVYLFKSPKDFLYLSRFQNQSEINFFKKESKKMYAEVIAPLSEHFNIETKVFKTEKLSEETTLRKQIYVSDFEGEYIVFKLGVQYDKKLLLINTKETLFNEKTQKIIKRDDVFESDFIEEFKELHPDFNTQEEVFFLSPNQLVENEWLLKTSQKLKDKNIEIFGIKDLKSFNFNLHKPVVSMGIKSDIDWFDVNIEIKYGKQKVSLRDIKKALLKKSKYIQLKDGTLGMLPDEWLKKFSKYFKAGEVKNDSIKISNYQFNIVDELYEDLENTPNFLLDLQRKKKQLQNLKDIEPIKLPKMVKATLRPYQNEGLNWLVFLHENNLGGCLADDMGLGKTLQTISLLAYLKSKKKAKLPHLIIAPTSLMFNWEKEIEKFCPSLKTLVYIGTKRKEHLKNFKKYDIILTTYGSVLNDIEFLKEESFEYVILDESQAIKNPNSKRYKAVRLLKSNNRLALTGTPIENNTFDLYAQMNFLNPGLLGSMGHFKTEFSDAIDKAKDESASELLHQIIHPFLLRRTKLQVATDLPEKTENILYCEMGKEQRKVYDAFKDKFREYLLNKIDENGVEKSQMYVLEGLTKLRQICNSPQLLNDEEDYGSASIKLDILLENIKTKTTNNKVLVFSQFTSMLQLIKERLENENIQYEYLDGKTRRREENVKNFQENEEIKVFLISLKAGGVGLNLTAAEYVFLVDPWWNPAVENQAIDRCYRIGQTKHVIAYRMICKDTIEEKIVDLQQNKMQVSDSIIQVDTVKKSFDQKQIRELFS